MLELCGEGNGKEMQSTCLHGSCGTHATSIHTASIAPLVSFPVCVDDLLLIHGLMCLRLREAFDEYDDHDDSVRFTFDPCKNESAWDIIDSSADPPE